MVTYLRQKTSPEASDAPTPNLPELIPALLTTIENNDGAPQEIVQAQVCLGWVHWALGEPKLAALRLPSNFTTTVNALLHDGKALSSWTEVCLVKGCYIKGSSTSGVTGKATRLMEIQGPHYLWLGISMRLWRLLPL